MVEAGGGGGIGGDGRGPDELGDGVSCEEQWKGKEDLLRSAR